MHNPYLILLDSPLDGLDPAMKIVLLRNIYALEKSNNSRGEPFNLIITAKNVEESYHFCNSFKAIKEGKLQVYENDELLEEEDIKKDKDNEQVSLILTLKIHLEKEAAKELDMSVTKNNQDFLILKSQFLIKNYQPLRASEPLTISIISLVMAAWRALL